MDISALEAFISVARFESFSKASAQLHLTQPAVSKRVANLEQELGVQLFNRVARQISLTEAGSQLLPRAQELVNHAKDLQTYAGSMSTVISGPLAIAISHHIGLHRMPPILSEFNARYPQVALDLRFEDSEQACQAVEQGDIEFAVITLPDQPPKSLITQTVWQDPLSIVVGQHHPLTTAGRIKFAQLADHPAVLPGEETETHQIILREFDRRQLNMRVQMQTNNLETLKMLAAAGLGWSLLPSGMLNDRLVALDTGLQLQRELGLVFHRQRSLSNAAAALRELIEKHSEI